MAKSSAWMFVSSLVCGALVLGCSSGVIRDPESSAGAGARSSSRPEQIFVRRMFVSTGEDRTAEEARGRAEMLSGMARDGSQSFRELVATYGETPPDRDDRNTVRSFDADEPNLSESAIRAVLELQLGQVSRPLETEGGFVLFERVSDPSAPDANGPSEIGARHILISHREASQHADSVTRTREEARALAEQVAEEARAEGADWVALHREHSDEPNSPSGGDLGVFAHGQMVREFEVAAFALDVDEISDPVESQFGFHVIQRTE